MTLGDSSADGIRYMRGFVYVIQMEGHPWFKIGQTRNVTVGAKDRVSSMQVGCPVPLHIVKEYPCESPKTIEWLVHKVLAGERRRGEWFETTLEDIDRAMMLVQEDPTFWMNEKQRERYERSLRNQQEVLRLVEKQELKDAAKAQRYREKARSLALAKAALVARREAQPLEANGVSTCPALPAPISLWKRLRVLLSYALRYGVGNVCLALAVVLQGILWMGATVLLIVVVAAAHLRKWNGDLRQSEAGGKVDVLIERQYNSRRYVSAWAMFGSTRPWPWA